MQYTPYALQGHAQSLISKLITNSYFENLVSPADIKGMGK